MKIRRIPPSIISRLRKAGFTTLESIAVAPVEVVSEVLRVDEEKALEVIQVAREKFKIEFKTADIVFNERFHNVKFISTGCRGLDEVLSGGVETGAVTEFVGEFGSGKTQLCHQLAVMVQLPPEAGGLSAKAIYIDTEGTFRPERIIEIAEYRGLDPKKALKNIYYTRIQSSDQQMIAVEEAEKLIETDNIRLLIVDSLVSHFRAEYIGREELVIRQQKLNRHVHQLLKIAYTYNIAVVVTNQVVSQPDSLIANPLRPVGGNIIAHSCTYRIWLRKLTGNKRAALIFDSPRHPESEAVFMITREGVVDVY